MSTPGLMRTIAPVFTVRVAPAATVSVLVTRMCAPVSQVVLAAMGPLTLVQAGLLSMLMVLFVASPLICGA